MTTALAPASTDRVIRRNRRKFTLGGTKRLDDDLIEVRLVGHDHRYVVRVDLDGPAPRLTELRIVADSPDAEIDPSTIRQVPVRRLAAAAARFVSRADGAFVTADEVADPTLISRPEVAERRGRRPRLDDDHYRQVAALLTEARRLGYSPREYVAEQMHAAISTVDRWIREAKRRGDLRRDWSTAD